MAGINLDWNAIRPLNGSRAEGFEELCAQLAREECTRVSRFERKGSPDAGVECYSVFADGSEWGWQAKYFKSLVDSQWSQLDESVKTALEKHPRLVRYFVCIPLNLPDARKDGQKSARDRWNDHVTKWSGWAATRGMSVEFVYWGEHELWVRLQRPEHAGRVQLFFDVHAFDPQWFSVRLSEAIKAAGPRYTPKVHVGLPIADEFDALGRTESFFDRIKGCARPLRQAYEDFQSSARKETDVRLSAATEKLASLIQEILNELGSLAVKALGELPLLKIAGLLDESLAAGSQVRVLLKEKERACNPSSAEQPHARERSQADAYQEQRQLLGTLISALRDSQKKLRQADRLASGSLMLLTGAAGTGKTHLLCDIAQQRIAAGKPTVLLMGQRFGDADPWGQALRQLDLASLRAEEFVGALEAVAQAADCRALLIIDALNEGEGMRIWPSNLAAFLAQLARSPWIAVALSIRSSYVDSVIPAEVQKEAVCIVHEGFAGHEYDAARTFFVHYGLEFPSTPLLAPEFRIPLFLKTLCAGLQQRGERRLPRGFHGITAIFAQYLEAINKLLSSSLGFNPKTPLVLRALESFCNVLVTRKQRGLPTEQAADVINAFLPGREFERSLYRGLVTEGILIEEIVQPDDGAAQEVVFISYERFADHLIAKTLLDKFLDPANPANAFSDGQPLAFLADSESDVEQGLIEAMCIQVPERTGREFFAIAPRALENEENGAAFRESLMWRATSAITDETRDIMNKLCDSEHALHSTLDALMTLASLPEHPLNATFLDRRLRKDSMAIRDAWWSVYLHYTWGSRDAVDRLVDWASAIAPGAALDEDVADLCATTLAWMLTTSNRFLRDRATKALVCLLTGRIPAVIRLIERFADVDDPYVTERIFAVAYGTAMRCHDRTEIGPLTKGVYARVFEGGRPPVHILLRDYARGVIERALALDADVEVDLSLIRPPYKSEWPTIPTESDLVSLLSDGKKLTMRNRAHEWARARIAKSVLDDDFAFYVIGTNSSQTSSTWLSLGLDEPAWTPPTLIRNRLRALISDFSEAEKRAWEAATRTDSAKSAEEEAAEREKKLEEANAALDAVAVLTEQHARRLNEILTRHERQEGKDTPPGFDLGQVQRYILRRVFELGWTAERFGDFDHGAVDHRGRDAAKAERIGKKYQWIAYHEILALLADHFQYRNHYDEERESQAYEGPWQDNVRDIDPSCALRATQGGTEWDSHTPAWWAPAIYDEWGKPSDLAGWTRRSDDVPNIVDLLVVANPTDGTPWVNLHGSLVWKQEAPADQEPTDIDRRELWLIFTAYLIRRADVGEFMKWAESEDFANDPMPSPPTIYPTFLGEHGWSPASLFLQQQFAEDGWLQPERGCPGMVRMMVHEYLSGADGFDCSVEKTIRLRLPDPMLMSDLGLRWNGDGNFIDGTGLLVAQDPTARTDGPTALLFRKDALLKYLAQQDMTIVWTVAGKKLELGRLVDLGEKRPSLRLSGAYVLESQGPRGFLRCLASEVSADASKRTPIGLIKTP